MTTSTPASFASQPSPTSTPPATAICESCSMELEKDMPSTLSASLTKDLREYEHERQRSKKATELVKAKERKEVRGAIKDKALSTTTSTRKAQCSCCRSEKGSRRPSQRKNLKALWSLGEGNGAEVVDVATPELSPVRGSLRSSRRSSHSIEVKLSDLVKPKKLPKNKIGDFEVIPHVRSVIVLDDFTGDNLEIEEPWEHVSGDDKDEEKAKSPSYAEIASK